MMSLDPFHIEELKKKDIVRAYALDTRKEVINLNVLEDAQEFAAVKKLEKQLHKEEAAAKHKPKKNDECFDEEEEEEEEEEKAVRRELYLAPPDLEVEEIPDNIDIHGFQKEFVDFAVKKGIQFIPGELHALSKEFAEDAKKIKGCINDLKDVFGWANAPKLGMGVVGGKIVMVVEGTLDQIKEISKQLGIKIKEVAQEGIGNRVDLNGNALPTPAPVKGVDLNGNALSGPAQGLANTPRPKPGNSAKAKEEEELDQSSYKSPTPFKMRPSLLRD